MKKLIFILMAFLVLSCSSEPNKIEYDNLNRNMDATILRIEVDSTQTPYEYIFYVKTLDSRYKELNVDPEWAIIFKEGDQI